MFYISLFSVATQKQWGAVIAPDCEHVGNAQLHVQGHLRSSVPSGNGRKKANYTLTDWVLHRKWSKLIWRGWGFMWLGDEN